MKLFDILSKYSSVEDLPQFANELNVGALLYDEVEASGENPFDTIGLMQLSQASQVQSKLWYVQKENIRRLSIFCAKHGIKMLIFKGYAMSLLYDKPESRKSGDVDVFFFEEEVRGERLEVREASHKMDELVKAKGRELEMGDKHSSFDVRETHIENHRHFVGTEEHPKLEAVEEYLLKQINETLRHENENEDENEALHYENCHPGDILIKSEEWPNVYYPSPNFNSVFLPVHMGEHFVNEGSSLHQLLDWIVFLEKCGDQVDWDQVYALATICGFRQWLDVLNGNSEIRKFGNSEGCAWISKLTSSSTSWFRNSEFPKCRDSEIPEKVLQELISAKSYDRDSREHTPLKYLWDRTIMTFRDGWKIRMVYDESPLKWYLRHAWNYVRKH